MKSEDAKLRRLCELKGRVLVGSLSKRFKTSLIAVRKDLEFLHHHGMLERTHGVALPVRIGALNGRTLQEKERLHRQEKLRIAAGAVKMIRSGQVIILDSGTTTISPCMQTFSQSHDHRQRDQYCDGARRNAGGRAFDRRNPPEKALFR